MLTNETPIQASAPATQETPAPAPTQEPTPSQTPPAPSAGTSTPSEPAASSAPRKSIAEQLGEIAQKKRAGSEKPAEGANSPAPSAGPSDKKEPQAAQKPGAQPPAVKPGGETPTPFTPNFKFKAYGKDFEIPEAYRGLVKDAASEAEVRDLFSAKSGLEILKPHLEEVKQQHAQLNQQFAGFVERLRPIDEAAKKGDIDFLVDEGVLSEENLLQWGIRRAQLLQASPEQRQAHEMMREQQRQSRALQSQMAHQDQSAQAQVHQARMQLLDYELARPEVASFVQQFESAQGRQPGAFKEAVRQYAEAVAISTQGKRDLTPQEAVREYLQTFAFQMPTPPQAAPGLLPTPPGNANPGAQSPQANAPQPPAQAAPQAPPAPPVKVVPNLQGRNASPTKRAYGSIKELKERSAELNRASRQG